MLSWSYDYTVGSRPWYKSVANASVNKPQSFEFVYFCTLSLEKVTEPLYNSMQHEWSMATVLTIWYKLSYTLTVPGVVAIVLRQTQCEPVFMSCTNSPMAGVTNAATIAGSCRPSTRGNFCFRRIWPACISESHSHVVLFKMWSFESSYSVRVEAGSSESWRCNHDFGSGELSSITKTEIYRLYSFIVPDDRLVEVVSCIWIITCNRIDGDSCTFEWVCSIFYIQHLHTVSGLRLGLPGPEDATMTSDQENCHQ